MHDLITERLFCTLGPITKLLYQKLKKKELEIKECCLDLNVLSLTILNVRDITWLFCITFTFLKTTRIEINSMHYEN